MELKVLEQEKFYVKAQIGEDVENVYYIFEDSEDEMRIVFEDEFEDDFAICPHCGRIVDKNDDYAVRVDNWDNDWYCDSDCASMDGYVQCDDCGCWIDEDEAIHYFDSDNVTCSDCVWDNDHGRCEQCGDYYYYPENLYYNDRDDCCYCQNCYPESSLRSYHTSKRKGVCPLYGKNEEHDSSTLIMGTELEIENEGYDYSEVEMCADKAYEIFGDAISCEEDGSLEDGMEMVGWPRSYLNYLENKGKYKDLFEYCSDNGMLGENSPNGGLHVHVNRSYFGAKKEQTGAITKLLYLFENNWDDLMKFSHRNEDICADTGECNWCKSYNVGELCDLEKIAANDAIDYDRYRAINLTNCATIEFRIFKSTLDVDRYFEVLTFVKNICEWAKNTPITEIMDVDFSSFIPCDNEENEKEAV